MLVLSRRLHEKIVLPSIQARIEIVSIKPGAVRLGIHAPPEVTVLREEVPDRAQEWGAAPPARTEAETRRLEELVRNRLRIAAKGLEQAREHLQGDSPRDADGLVERVAEDLRLLDRRLDPPARPKARIAPRALIVEDDRNERELLAGLLRMAGVQVDTAGDGIDALDHLRNGQPDVVLLDMGLPRCDGATTVRRIRHDPAYRALKIYAVTGSAPEQFNLDDVGPRGVDRWFRKPVDSEALLRDLTEACAVTGA